MDNIEIEFFEEYKKLDNLCKDLFRSNLGVTKYIEEMEKTPFIDRRLVNSWNNYYDMLKHVKWIRNNIAHNNEYSGCNKDDVENIKNFYQQIIEQKDPFSIINEKNKELQEYNEVNRMEENREIFFVENNKKTRIEFDKILMIVFAIMFIMVILFLPLILFSLVIIL